MSGGAAAATIENNRWLLLDLASMASPSNPPASERARLEERLALIDLLIALSDESVAGQRVLAEQSGLKGAALAEVLIKLTIIESSSELRKTDRKRLLESLLGLEAR
jgi:hypothetical protein